MKTKLIAICHLLSAIFIPCFAQGTAFTYQGRLNDGVNPANGIYDLRFALYDDASGTAQVGAALTNAATGVTNGLFTVPLDFGAGVFTGSPRWLAIEVRTNGGGAFTTLAPPQKLTPTPYALYAPNAGAATTAGTASSVAAANITGTLPVTALPVSVLTNGQGGVNLTGGIGAVLLVEEGVVVLRRVEGRIEINDIHGLVFEIAAEDVEAVAVVKNADARRGRVVSRLVN